jgi:hypothetical protein
MCHEQCSVGTRQRSWGHDPLYAFWADCRPNCAASTFGHSLQDCVRAMMRTLWVTSITPSTRHWSGD